MSTHWQPGNNDLPTSGVTAGTYGDSTHVAQVTVSAAGLVTSASNVAVGGGGGGVTDVDGITGSVTLVAGSNVTITDNSPAAGQITIAASGSGGVASLDSITGAVTLVAGSNVTITDNSPAAGEITIAATGSGGGGLTSLFDSGYLGADAASIDTGAGGIASGHFGLLIIGYLRSTLAVGNDNIGLTFNNDTSAIYQMERLTASGGGASASGNVGLSEPVIGVMPGASADPGYYGSLQVSVPAYDGTANYKVAHGHSAAIDVSSSQVVADWATTYASTAAISRLRIRSEGGAGNIKAGSRLIVYGLQ